MTFRMSACQIALAAVLLCSTAAVGANVQSSKSTGLTVSISKVIISEKKVILQFIATNNTSARVYIRDASGEDSQKAFLGTGEKLPLPSLVGIENCNNSVPSCMKPDSGYNGNDLNVYSYIEPNEFTSFAFTYEAQTPVSESDTISFSAAIIARFSTPNGDPGQAGAMKVIRFNFPYVSLKPH